MPPQASQRLYGHRFERPRQTPSAMASTFRLGRVWDTADPFLFCVHHNDNYPTGNEDMCPDPKTLQGRAITSDFSGKDGWSMYHGTTVPGFPRHPHRGFETVTLVRSGHIDHSDSLGATARFGQGDCQWMTAGRGIEHCEMFPLLHTDRRNPLELFQIWLNLPAASKRVDPYFTMLWAGNIPQHSEVDAGGAEVASVTVVAGSFRGLTPPPPPPDSWAAVAENEVAIWAISMKPGAALQLPRASAGVKRRLYFFAGSTLQVDDVTLQKGFGAVLDASKDVRLRNGDTVGEALVLQGRPIDEPVVQHGPFVMNSPEEINQAFVDYRAGMFGKWDWGKPDPVHNRSEQRFAFQDGKREVPA